MPRNLMLISLDTLRFDALSCAPDRRLLGEDAALAATPALDRIAGEGAFFARAVTTCPYTSPSHSAIFTGTHWPKHGVLDLFQYRLNAEVQTLAEALRERGWRAGQNAGRGWRDGDMFDDDKVGLNRGYDFEAFGGWLRRKTRRWLRRVSGKAPWHLFWHTMAVHRPYGKSHRVFRKLVRRDLAAGTPFRNLRRLYLRNVTEVDRKFGKVWRELERRGLLEETLVVILSDHGEGLSRHCTIHNNHGGWSEGVCRVPIILWCPGEVAPGQVIEEPVSTVDVAPTISELLGIDWEQPLGFDGRSMAGAVRGVRETGTVSGRFCYFSASMSGGPPPEMHGCVEGTQKYVSFAQAPDEHWQDLRRRAAEAAAHRKKQSRHYNMTQALERVDRGELEMLFDIATDPEERQNRAEKRPERLQEMREAMAEWYRRHEVKALRHVEMDATEEREVARRLKQLGYMD